LRAKGLTIPIAQRRRRFAEVLGMGIKRLKRPVGQRCEAFCRGEAAKSGPVALRQDSRSKRTQGSSRGLGSSPPVRSANLSRSDRATFFGEKSFTALPVGPAVYLAEFQRSNRTSARSSNGRPFRPEEDFSLGALPSPAAKRLRLGYWNVQALGPLMKLQFRTSRHRDEIASRHPRPSTRDGPLTRSNRGTCTTRPASMRYHRFTLNCLRKETQCAVFRVLCSR
jgi:hypothetical protein